MSIVSNIFSRKISDLPWIKSVGFSISFVAFLYPLRNSLADSISHPDIILSVDALSIEQSQVYMWLAGKYPFLIEWAAKPDDEFKTLKDMFKATGLDAKDFSRFSFCLDGLSSLVEANSSGKISFSQIYLDMNLWAEKPMNLVGFINWLESELAGEIWSKKALGKILVDKSIDDAQLRFSLNLTELDTLFGGNSKSSASIDNNFSVQINLEENRTKIRGFLTNQKNTKITSLDNFTQVSLLSLLASDSHVSFYLKIPVSTKINDFSDGQAGNPLDMLIEGIDEIAWGVSFRDHSVCLQLLVGCQEKSIASSLSALLQGSLGMVQLGFLEDVEARGLLDLVRKVKFNIKDNLLEVSLEATSEELDQIISQQLTSFAPKPPLKFHSNGPKSLQGQEAPEVFLPTFSDDEFSLVSQRGKVVVLDFWASWCKPCRMALPILLKVSSRYPASKFCLMTINQEETKEEISHFLSRYDLAILPVSMDLDGEISKAFQVKGIPQTVIINQQGYVEKVWVGFSPFLENDLVAEINELLAR